MNTAPTLENKIVRLSPLTLHNYKELLPIASQEKLVQYSPSDIATPKALKNYVEVALEQQGKGSAIPFIVFDKGKGQYAGATRYMHIDRRNKVLHIGSTWIGREFQGSGLNSHMKLLMLDHAFEVMGFEKVEFRIDERNIRSRKAVEKLGAILEGTLRKNVYLLDGYKRNTCCYGILKEEWAATRIKNFKAY
ncbi:GNAT family N-acetyltransferase [Pseudozobellia thermophila]|uniref:Protein N-acetyltransferase, RimJ/RimL family n=1 Tax=Pseudozobellia thermophila TaxID=192903 RepID=A0A1M6LE33_9FLAO|nr:GNAT family protein [Pseudozobellia thermophila]SHJ69402.1 Protein N-acetyltransferase, RimJ/RimL family [Pseudozobellia thermophila]